MQLRAEGGILELVPWTGVVMQAGSCTPTRPLLLRSAHPDVMRELLRLRRGEGEWEDEAKVEGEARGISE